LVPFLHHPASGSTLNQRKGLDTFYTNSINPHATVGTHSTICGSINKKHQNEQLPTV